MPFVDRKEASTIGPVGLIEPRVTGGERDISFWSETVPAAFELENTVASIYANRDPVPQAEPKADFDPFESIRGTTYEDFADAFVEAESPEQVSWIKRKLDRETKQIETLMLSGASGWVAALAAGVLDPVLLVPFGSALRTIRIAEGASSVVQSLLRGGVVAARAGLLGQAASEAILHFGQDTRTYGQSALNISAAALLSGVFGAKAGLTDALWSRAIKQAESDLGVVAGGSERAGSQSLTIRAPLSEVMEDAANGTNKTEIRVKNAFGVEKALAMLHTSPMLRLMVRSRSQEAKRLIMEMADQGFIVQGFEGGRSVESNLLAWDAVRGHLSAEGDRLYTVYRNRVSGEKVGGRARRAMIEAKDRIAGKSPGVLSKKEFLEAAGKSGRIGDIAGISPQGRAVIPEEAAQLARLHRELVYDPIAKELVRLELLPEEILTKGPKFAASYMRRMYLRNKVLMDLDVEGTPNFRKRIKLWLYQKLEPEEIEKITALHEGKTQAEAIELELDRAADDIVGNITGEGMGRVVYGRQRFGSPNILKERALDFDDEFVMDFLENDIDVLTHGYLRTAVPDIELRDRFGSPDMTEAFDGVRKEYRSLLSKAKTAKERGKLVDQRKEDLRILAAIRDRLRGTYAAPDEKWGKLITAGRVARVLNMTAQGGSFMVSSLPDVMMPVVRHGVTRAMKPMMTVLARGLRPLRLAAAEVRKAGVGWEVVLDTRMRYLADIGDEFARNRVEQVAKSAASNFSLMNLLSPWNSALKQWSGVVGQSRLIEIIDALAHGRRVKAADLEDLAQLRLQRPMIDRIARELTSPNGSLKEGAIRWANTDAWADSEAVLAFRSALRQMVDNTIITPGVGDRPLFFSSELGKTMFQYKSFALASTQRLLLTNLQRRDLATMNGLFLSVGVGAFVETFKTWNAGRELPSENTATYLIGAGLDRSGMIGIIGDAFNFADKLGFGFVHGGPLSSRYAARNAASSLMGPTMGLTETGFRLASATRKGFTEGDVRALRRLVPYQNLFYLRKLLDQVEEDVNDSLHIPKTRKRR